MANGSTEIVYSRRDDSDESILHGDVVGGGSEQ